MENPSILIVDDMMDMRVLIKTFLKISFPGIELDEANCGKDALKRLESGKHDLILCDWELPDMKGDEILKWIKGQERLKEMPFIMVTAHNEKEYILNAVQLGVSDYIIKPFNSETLNSKINKALRRP